MQNQTQVINVANIPLENILVVPTNILFFEGIWQGLRGVDQLDLPGYMHVIQTECLFLPRPEMEANPAYKQIIPYLVFRYQNKYFLMQRASKASESRLRSKFSLGIGGHIRQEDMQGSSIFKWARREFAEEVNYSGNLDVQMLGILNDDSNEVGKVHVGLVMLLTGDSDQISVNEELKSGELLTLAECELFQDQMESWTRLVFDYLKNN